MSDKNGRTWDQCKVILTDGREITGYLDTTWGHYFYFDLASGVRKMSRKDWRKAKIDVFFLDKELVAKFVPRPTLSPKEMRKIIKDRISHLATNQADKVCEILHNKVNSTTQVRKAYSYLERCLKGKTDTQIAILDF